MFLKGQAEHSCFRQLPAKEFGTLCYLAGMNSIVAITDFSAAAAGAVDYAAALAHVTNLPLKLVHTYSIPILYSPEALAPTLLPVTETRNHAQAQLEQAVAQLRARHASLQIEGRLALEDAEDALLEDDAAGEALLVIGTVPGQSHEWWEEDAGSDLLRNAHRTVLAVPAGTTYRPVKNIALALDPDNLPKQFSFLPLLRWVALTGAALQVITVGEAAVPDAVVQALLAAQPQYHRLKGAGTVDEILLNFAEQSHTDWLAVVPGVYGFWSSLFHKSHTKALVEKITVPLLTLHAPL